MFGLVIEVWLGLSALGVALLVLASVVDSLRARAVAVRRARDWKVREGRI